MKASRISADWHLGFGSYSLALLLGSGCVCVCARVCVWALLRLITLGASSSSCQKQDSDLLLHVVGLVLRLSELYSEGSRDRVRSG